MYPPLSSRDLINRLRKDSGNFSLAAMTLLSLFGISLLSGCGEAAKAATPPPLPVVRVMPAETVKVADKATFTGQFQAVDSVRLRPRVNGYIEEVRFTEGSDVNKGDILFVIDQRPYQLSLQLAEADLASAKAQKEVAQAELNRSSRLLKGQAVSEEEFGRRQAQQRTAEAQYQAALAAVEQARLNLEYTQVVAPISGKASRANITVGNYVTAGETVLTSLVSRNPMYVIFDSDEQSYLQYAQLVQQGLLPPPAAGQTRIAVGLATDADFPYQARLDFIDNALDPATGTIRARAVIDNTDGRFAPGMVARVQMQLSAEYPATLLDETVIGTDQDRKYVLVVNDQNIAEYRAIELGGLYQGKRIIRQGLSSGDRVVVGGQLRVHPGMAVSPEPTGEPLAMRY